MIIEELWKVVRKYILFVLILFFIIFFAYNVHYPSDYYELKINNQDIFRAYSEIYDRILIPFLFVTRNGYEGTEGSDNFVNRIKFTENLNLKFKIISCYAKDDNRHVDCYSNYIKNASNYIYKKNNLKDIKMIVSRKNKVIYDGFYKENISDIVTEPGRYYFVLLRNFKYEFYGKGIYRINFNVIVESE